MNQPRSLRESTLLEAEAMTRYLLAEGRACPAPVVQTLEDIRRGETPDMQALVKAHTHLARLVAPATPASVRLLDQVSQQEPGRWSTLGAVKLVRQMMAVAILSVVAFVGLSLFRAVGADGIDLSHGSGLGLFLNELFWMAAAAMGASFAMLFQVNQYITERTYDPAYAPSYWIKLLLGVIAGFILVALIPFPEPAATAAAGGAAPGAAEGMESTAAHFTRPLIAMLGGFSASAVYGIMSRLVEAVENLFAGSAREQAAVREAAAVLRVNGEAAESRIAVAGRLVQVQQQLAAGGSPDELARRLQEVIDGLVGADAAAPTPAPAPEPEPQLVPAFVVVGDGRGAAEEDDGEAKG